MITFKEWLIYYLTQNKTVTYKWLIKNAWMHWEYTKKLNKDLAELVADNKIEAEKLEGNDFKFELV